MPAKGGHLGECGLSSAWAEQRATIVYYLLFPNRSFKDTANGLEIEATLTQAPDGIHGFHIHEFGSCAEAGNGAGGHYNPEGVNHGLLIENGFADAHAGDLGNLEIKSGQATYRATLPGLTLNASKHPIAGRAVILHEKPDDFGQPTGNAGGRVGCGTIALSKSA